MLACHHGSYFHTELALIILFTSEMKTVLMLPLIVCVCVETMLVYCNVSYFHTVRA